MRQMFLFSYSKWQPWNCISLQMATLWLHAGVQMRIIYSSSLSSCLGSGLRGQMRCALIAVFSIYLPPPFISTGSTGVISFFHLPSLSLSHFLSFPSTTETWRWVYLFPHQRTKLSNGGGRGGGWVCVCVCVGWGGGGGVWATAWECR